MIANKKNFTLIELLVVFSILLILASLLQPSFSRIIGSAHQTRCLALQKNIHTCSILFSQDNNDFIVPTGLRGNPGKDAIIPTANYTFWPDLLKVYIQSLENVRCSSTLKFGIGSNHPELGQWLRMTNKISHVRQPAKTVMYADSALIENFDEKNPDLWAQTNPEKPSYLFRTPNDGAGGRYYNSNPKRVFNRHLGRVNVMNVDGHGENILASEIGFQFPRNHKNAHWDR